MDIKNIIYNINEFIKAPSFNNMSRVKKLIINDIRN